MIPEALVGFAVLVLVWLLLWWLVGGRKPRTARACRAEALAFGVLALDYASRRQPEPAVICLLLCALAVRDTERRERVERRQRVDSPERETTA